jgi:all-trans-retinol dehydrogenase (NAD+)
MLQAGKLAPLTSIALNPNIVGTLHFILTKAPAKIREPARNFLTKRLGESATEKVIKTLGWLTFIALAKKINERLDEWALNNWVWKPQTANWTWSWEVAVVTGGSQGIGRQIVKGLLERDVKVAVLDIAPLPAEFEKSMCPTAA